MNGLIKLALAWNTMWGMSYLVTAVIAPWLSGLDYIAGFLLYAILGMWIILSVVVLPYADKTGISILRVNYWILGVIEVVGGITSWTGLATWNVPYNIGLANVSMALADLLSAVFFFALSEQI